MFPEDKHIEAVIQSYTFCKQQNVVMDKSDLGDTGFEGMEGSWRSTEYWQYVV